MTGTLPAGFDTPTVPLASTAPGQEWRVVVTPSDGTLTGPSGEDTAARERSSGGASRKVSARCRRARQASSLWSAPSAT